MKEAQPPQVLLEHYLKRLKLPSMLKAYKAIAELCAQERADYTTFLLRLAEREPRRAGRFELAGLGSFIGTSRSFS